MAKSIFNSDYHLKPVDRNAADVTGAPRTDIGSAKPAKSPKKTRKHRKDECGKNVANISSHKEKKHKLLCCPKCNINIKGEKLLRKHLKKCEEKPIQSFPCRKCGKPVVNQPDSHKAHAKDYHNQYKCFKCDEVFVGYIKLKEHERTCC